MCRLARGSAGALRGLPVRPGAPPSAREPGMIDEAIGSSGRFSTARLNADRGRKSRSGRTYWSTSAVPMFPPWPHYKSVTSGRQARGQFRGQQTADVLLVRLDRAQERGLLRRLPAAGASVCSSLVASARSRRRRSKAGCQPLSGYDSTPFAMSRIRAESDARSF